MPILAAQPVDPASAAPSYGGMSRMTGGAEEGVGPDEGAADPQKALANLVQTIRMCDESVMSVAGNNPELAKEVRAARAALSAILKKAIAGTGGSSEVNPRTEY